MGDWVSFYDFKHSIIYVNERHRDVHYRTIAQDIRRYIPSPNARVLDYGSGEATSAETVADACGALTMAEAAPNVRASLTMRYAGNPKISVVTPEGAAALPPGSFELIVMHSVAQYLTGAQLDKQLAVFRKLVKPGGLLIVGDVVPPNFSAPAAAIALLRFGAQNGFLGAAIFGLIRIVTSDYLRLRKSVGLSRYPEAAMIERLRLAGFAATRAERNIGHNQWRMTFLARPQ
ncbi:MAG TPA: methyltransferase domain-containing protein [Pseudolabrys sp.]|jgi:SAM-dependent methyltransferase|nr:methyltransferase domain-containing protein [Pseudolabrys sp.]